MYIKLTGILLSFLFLFSCAGLKKALKKDTPEIEEVVEKIEEESTIDSLQEEENIVQNQEESAEEAIAKEEDVSKDEPKEKEPTTLPISPTEGSIPKDIEMQFNALNTEITQLRSELDYYTEMLKDLNAKSSVWGNPFSVYNKEIILADGTTLYGKIIYQDQSVLKIETLIGGMVIPRSSVVRVVQNITKLNDDGTVVDTNDDSMENNFEEINNPDSGISLIERKNSPREASLQMLGEISDNIDGAGNRVIRGNVKNTGTQRADFSRITFTIRKNWEGDVFRENAWINGTTISCPDNNVSSNSLLPNATGKFTLIIPASKGDIIGYTHDLHWEQMDNCKDAE